jgi:hypothetical protein
VTKCAIFQSVAENATGTVQLREIETSRSSTDLETRTCASTRAVINAARQRETKRLQPPDPLPLDWIPAGAPSRAASVATT